MLHHTIACYHRIITHASNKISTYDAMVCIHKHYAHMHTQWGGPELADKAHWYDSYNDSRFFELLKASLDPEAWKARKAALRAEAAAAEVRACLYVRDMYVCVYGQCCMHAMRTVYTCLGTCTQALYVHAVHMPWIPSQILVFQWSRQAHVLKTCSP